MSARMYRVEIVQPWKCVLNVAATDMAAAGAKAIAEALKYKLLDPGIAEAATIAVIDPGQERIDGCDA